MKTKRLLLGIAKLTADLCRADNSDDLVATLLDGSRRHLGYEHTMLMLIDERSEQLFTVATRGFSPSGVGSEQRIGEGVWGKVAERRAPLRIVNLRHELAYAHAVRKSAARAGDERLTRAIALPGLANVESILATPLVAQSELVGVFGAQSPERLAFDGDDESAVSVIALTFTHRLIALRDVDDADGAAPEAVPTPAPPARSGGRIVRYYRADDSIFVDHDYVIKGLPGRILWRLLCEHAIGRSTFSNKELRVDPALKLSTIRDNLESRLILLRNRLDEKACGMRLLKRGRGQFALAVTDAFELIEV